jgi:ribosomal-protein-alanine N-acetyltransferase
MMVDIQILGAEVAPDILQQLANLPHLSNEPHWTQLQLQKACTGSEQVLGVFVNRDIVGYMVAAQALDQADIHTLFIATNWRGQGLAKTLLQAMLDKLKKQAVTQVFLEVRQGNRVAQNLYQDYGFAITGERVNYYKNTDGSRENAILMSAYL